MNPKAGSRIPNPESRTPNSESRIPNPESRTPNPESRIPNPESRIPKLATPNQARTGCDPHPSPNIHHLLILLSSTTTSIDKPRFFKNFCHQINLNIKYFGGLRVGWLNEFSWEGCRESSRCSRDTYPGSCITKYTSIRR